ncbi:hypothetical protein BJY52DRAFT_803833 [Lactarius psammicola]|nr:hypothetical protein BJY52DRAFT_803833 [Lactarius psammicola]
MTICLPFEILTAIFEEIDNIHDLWRIRTASRTLCAAATPIAFRVLSVISTRGSAQNLGRLFNIPDIAAHIKEVAYDDTGADRRGWMLKYGAPLPGPPTYHERYNDCTYGTSTASELASSFSRVHQLPQLETVDLKFYPRYEHRLNFDNKDRLALQASILSALATSFSIRAPPNLTSLSLHNLRTWDLSSLESPPFQTVLATLRRLQLSVLFFSPPVPFTSSAPWCHFWGTLFPHMILAPTQHTLTELTLHSDIYVGASSGLSFAGLHFPHLCVLSLRNLIFQPFVAVEPFVLRHAATLTRLELFACRLPTSFAGGEFSISGSGGWEHIWDRFAAELTALVALRVDERGHRPSTHSNGPECWYVVELEKMAYWEIDLHSRKAADVAALRRFHMTVTARLEEVNRAS